MKRLALTLMAVGILTATIGGAALAAPPEKTNSVSYWCEQGQKFEPVSTPWIVPPPPEGYAWTKAVVKAGAGEDQNAVFEPISVGQSLSHPSGKDNSHIILCKEPVQVTTTTTTVPETTTTTVPETTTTTVPETTTTTVPETTTTTVIDTTTTVPEETTTTVAETTTTVPETTTTTVPEELPMTGPSGLGWFALFGGASLVLGGAALRAARE